MDGFVDIADVSRKEIQHVYDVARRMKEEPERFHDALSNRTLLMLFEKPSTRTRVSFEAGMTQLGGHGIYFYSERSQMSRGEALADTARVLSRYCDAVMARLFDHEQILELQRHADVPVINGLTDRLHPCQALSDFFTLQEEGVNLRDGKLAYVGDGNNVAHSLIQTAAALGTAVAVASPEGYEPDAEIVREARERTDATIDIVNDPVDAVNEADAVYTDVWVSMGDKNPEQRKQDLQRYQVNEELLEQAKPGVRAMHCLPAHRGEEITDGVMDGEHSVIFDQAENRMHVQKALLHVLLN